MSEIMTTIGLMLGFVFVVVAIIMMREKFPLFDKFLRFLGKIFVFVFLIVWSGLMIFAYSFLGVIVIGIDMVNLSENNFLYAGESLNLLRQEDELSIVKFAGTFGVFYLVSYVACTILYDLLKVNVWVTKVLVFITTSLLVVFVYPITIRAIFPEAYVSTKGGLLLVTVVVLIFVKQLITKEIREMERYSNVYQYIFNRIVPWIKTGRRPDTVD